MSVVDIYVLRTHGQEHSGLCMGIMKDTKQLILAHSQAIILVVMAVVGNKKFNLFQHSNVQFAASCDNLIFLRDKDGYHWLTGRVDDVINVRYVHKLTHLYIHCP